MPETTPTPPHVCVRPAACWSDPDCPVYSSRSGAASASYSPPGEAVVLGEQATDAHGDLLWQHACHHVAGFPPYDEEPDEPCGTSGCEYDTNAWSRLCVREEGR